MSQEYTTAQLERMVLGKVEKPNVVFYDQSKMDPDKSKEANKRVYTTVLMVKYTQPGVTDWAPQRAQKQDIENNREAYELYLQTKGDVGAPSVTIIPGIRPDESQELIDYGIVTITKLCDAEVLPPHLQHLQASARRLNEVLKNEQIENERTHTSEETGSVEGPGRGGPQPSRDHQGGPGHEDRQAYPGQEEDRQVPSTDRQVDTIGVRRRVLPAGAQDRGGEGATGIHQGGRVDHREGAGTRQEEVDHKPGRQKEDRKSVV